MDLPFRISTGKNPMGGILSLYIILPRTSAPNANSIHTQSDYTRSPIDIAADETIPQAGQARNIFFESSKTSLPLFEYADVAGLT